MSVTNIPRDGVVETPQGFTWYENGLISRPTGPAVIIYFKDAEGNLTENERIVKYYSNGKLTGAPAVIEYEQLGPEIIVDKKFEYYSNNRLHRVGAPAKFEITNILRGEDRIQYLSEFYYTNGRLSNGTATVDLGGGVTTPFAVKKFTGEVEMVEGETTTYVPKFTYESYVNGIRRSISDAPAIVTDVYGTNIGDRYWYNITGKLHRLGNPAVILASGREEWYVDGKRSRSGGLPAVINPVSYEGGTQGKSWYLDGKLHRIGEEALVEDLGTYRGDTLVRTTLRKEFWTYGKNHLSTTDTVSEELKSLALLDPPDHFMYDSVVYEYSTPLSTKSNPVYYVEDSPGILLVGYRSQNQAYFTTGLATQVITTDVATEAETTSYTYLVNGFGHRVGGPAILREDGTEEYWVDGKLHRTDGPAIVRPNGTNEYYIEGKRSRTGGPGLVLPDGTEEHWVNGKLSRGDDLPAVIRPNGITEYYTDGKRNRIGAPAVEYPPVTIGSETFTPFEYWENGVIVRGGDLPAVRRKNGDREWYLGGKLHREENPAIIRQDGTEEWYENGLLSRVGGPAISKPNGYQAYYLKGKLHRTDGPAIVYPDGSEEWYIRKLSENTPTVEEMVDDGKTEEEILKIIEDNTQSVRSRGGGELPAVIRKRSGINVLEEYWVDGYKIRGADLPAVIVRDSNGTITRREWWDTITYGTETVVVKRKDGVKTKITKIVVTVVNVLNRSGDPAVIEVKNGITREEYWDRGGKNLEGTPAVIEYNEDFPILNEYWKSTYDEDKNIVTSSFLERDPDNLSLPVVEKFNPQTGDLVYTIVKNAEGKLETVFPTP